MNIISKYVAYIVSKKIDGNETHGVGVIVGDYLVTAGHVLEAADKAYATVDGNTYCLDDSNRVFLQSMGNDDEDPTHNDIAIYTIDNVDSPLQLSDKLPEINSTYTNVYIVEETIVSDDESLPPMFRESTSLNLETSGSVFEGEYVENFFACKTEKILKEGNSGCPLLDGRIVYGILHGGVPDKPRCVYQSAKSIISCLEKINKQ